MFQKKPSASEVDGVQYRRAKLWQIICYACNAFVGMSVYSLIGMASYSASIGYGITTATVGLILMLARILDGFTDPMPGLSVFVVMVTFSVLTRPAQPESLRILNAPSALPSFMPAMTSRSVVSTRLSSLISSPPRR